MIRVLLPYHLRNLAKVEGEIILDRVEHATLGSVVDALEGSHPVLKGTLRDYGTLRRRPFIRFFVCREDWSLHPIETPLPEAIVNGSEPFLVVGAMAGG